MKQLSDYKIVDIFSGGGGLSLGFEQAGFSIAAAFDNWDAAIEFHKKNIGHPIFKCDLSDVESAIKVIQPYQPDVIIGGPPCQDFSSAGKRDEGLGRADLTISFANIIEKIRPQFFVMENVERAIRSNAFASASKLFSDSGYGLTIQVLDASKCGVPQIRKRLFVIGELNGPDNALDSLLVERQSAKRMTIRDYLGGKINIDHYYRHPRSYERRAIFSIDEPSPTIRGVNRPLPAGYPGHPGDKVSKSASVRSLTTRERALIQTFPDDIDLSGTKTDVEQIIGNAVPINLARFVAEALSSYLSEESQDGRRLQATAV